MSRIFISYRRSDATAEAGRIYDYLESRFSRKSIFIDVDALQAGEDFRERIQDAVGQCQVLLAIMGRSWLRAQDENGQRRLENPADWVRLEIEAALERQVTVIPVLSDGVLMPKVSELPLSLQPLAYRQAAYVRHGRDFKVDMERLTQVVHSSINNAAQQSNQEKTAQGFWQAKNQANETVQPPEKTTFMPTFQQSKKISDHKTERSSTKASNFSNRLQLATVTAIVGSSVFITSFLALVIGADSTRSSLDKSPPAPSIETNKPNSSQSPAISDSPKGIDAAAISDAPIYVEGTAIREAWVSIVADNETIFEGGLQPGDSQLWEAQERLSIFAGDAGALEISANGKAPEIMGESGIPEERVFP